MFEFIISTPTSVIVMNWILYFYVFSFFITVTTYLLGGYEDMSDKSVMTFFIFSPFIIVMIALLEVYYMLHVIIKKEPPENDLFN